MEKHSELRVAIIDDDKVLRENMRLLIDGQVNCLLGLHYSRLLLVCRDGVRLFAITARAQGNHDSRGHQHRHGQHAHDHDQPFVAHFYPLSSSHPYYSPPRPAILISQTS